MKARPWYERAVTEAEQGDVHGRVDHESLGRAFTRSGIALSGTGDDEGADPGTSERSLEKEKGDVHGGVDHESLVASKQALDTLSRERSG